MFKKYSKHDRGRKSHHLNEYFLYNNYKEEEKNDLTKILLKAIDVMDSSYDSSRVSLFKEPFYVIDTIVPINNYDQMMMSQDEEDEDEGLFIIDTYICPPSTKF
jgi:hypothetical protein